MYSFVGLFAVVEGVGELLLVPQVEVQLLQEALKLHELIFRSLFLVVAVSVLFGY